MASIDIFLASLKPRAPPLPELIQQATAAVAMTASASDHHRGAHGGDDEDDEDEDAIDIPSDFEGDPDDYVEEQLALRRRHKRQKLAHVAPETSLVSSASSSAALEEATAALGDPEARPFATPGNSTATSHDEDCCWAGLPRRAVHTVFLMLDYSDLFQLRRVNRSLNAELELDSFWAQRFRQDFPQRWEALVRRWGAPLPPGPERSRWNVRQLLFWHLNQLVGQSFGDEALQLAAMHRYLSSVLRERYRRHVEWVDIQPSEAGSEATAASKSKSKFSAASVCKTRVTVDLLQRQ